MVTTVTAGSRRSSAFPRLTPAVAVFVAGTLAAVLQLYIFGITTVLSALLWLGVGGVIGWVGSLILRSNTQRRILLDIATGAVGGICGVLLVGGGSFTEIGPVERILSAFLGGVAAVLIRGLGGRIRRRANFGFGKKNGSADHE